MIRAAPRALFLLGFLLIVGSVRAENAPPPTSASATASVKVFDLAFPQAVADATPFLAARAVNDSADPNGGWFTLAVANNSGLPVVRVLAAVDPSGAALDVAPPLGRPLLNEAVSSDAGVIVERALTPEDHAFRIVVPPGGMATVALHTQNFSGAMPLLAWSEPALIAHQREAALLSGVAAGLLAAAAAFAAGATALSGRLYARWAAVFLATVLFAELTAAGFFDGSLIVRLGGPYGLFAFALSLCLAAAIRLIDHVASFEARFPGASLWRDSVALGVLVTGLAALAGVPVAALLVRCATLIGAAAAAGYLLHCGRIGIAGARRLAPAGAIFALVAAAADLNAFGFFGVNLVAAGAMGGFAAAGALLVALATTVPIEPAKGRLREFAEAHAGDDLQSPVTDDALDKARYLAAIAASRQGVFDLHLDTGAVALSPEAAAILDLAGGAFELDRNAWRSRIFPEDRAVYDHALDTYRRDPGAAFRLEFRARAGHGRTLWIELRATMVGEATEAERCLGLIADVTQRKAAETLEHRTGQADLLTGFGNRAALISRLEAERAEFERLALAVFDLDRFKQVNDSLGRLGGDALLTAFAERLERAFAVEREAGRAAFFRIGGDMFAMLAAGAGDLSALGGRIVEAARAPFKSGNRDIYLPTSVGVASGATAASIEELIAQAERAMVEAKRQGGDRASVYSALLAGQSDDPVAIDADLRRAIERGEIELHYQPIIRLKDRSIAGFEALLRWRHPRQRLVEPDGFIPHAERSGLIVALGRFALERSLADLARWQSAFPSNPPLFLSVNIAWRQIAEKTFVKELDELLKAVPVARDTVKLELTESAVMTGAKKAETALKRLKAIGVGLAIDDFGTGHSSLSHLRRFPFDTVKIDKSFLAAADDKAGAAILTSIVSLANDLDLTVVAEGVEREIDAAHLESIGCAFGQGFLFGQPIFSDDVEAFLAANRNAP